VHWKRQTLAFTSLRGWCRFITNLVRAFANRVKPGRMADVGAGYHVLPNRLDLHPVPEAGPLEARGNSVTGTSANADRQNLSKVADKHNHLAPEWDFWIIHQVAQEAVNHLHGVTVSHGTLIPHNKPAARRSPARCDCVPTLQTEMEPNASGILKVEWAVRLPGRRVAAIPDDDAVARATLF
jgi:hypothetical protein